MYTFTLKTLANEVKVLKADMLEPMVNHFTNEGYMISSVVLSKSNTCVMDRVMEIVMQNYSEWKKQMVKQGMFN